MQARLSTNGQAEGGTRHTRGYLRLSVVGTYDRIEVLKEGGILTISEPAAVVGGGPGKENSNDGTHLILLCVFDLPGGNHPRRSNVSRSIQ